MFTTIRRARTRSNMTKTSENPADGQAFVPSVSAEVCLEDAARANPHFKQKQDETEAIVFFDGVCGLCDATVTFLARHDRRGVLKYAPLQGETAVRLLNADERDLNSLAFRHHGRTWRHSAAVVRIFWTVGGWWRILAALLWLVPRPLRDLGYRCVAKIRYRLFGRHETCRLPSPEERSRFLD